MNRQYVLTLVALLFLTNAQAAQAADSDPATALGPVPSVQTPPQPKRTYFGLPVVKSAQSPDGETITLSNEAISVTLKIDSSRAARMVSLRTQGGPELLKTPAACFTVLDSQGAVAKDGAAFQVESWRPSYCSSYSEIVVAMKAQETVVWRLRLYIDKPYLEQRFEMPKAWRAAGNSVRQVLSLQPSLRPVMPNCVFLKGFSNGRPNLKDRSRFEFVQQSDHLTYDPTAAAGLATFVAGIGGEEIIVHDSLSMIDQVTLTLGPAEPIARFILWPFAGPAELGFRGIKRFVADEYLTKTSPTDKLIWTQFFTWQWVPKKPLKPSKTPGGGDPYHREEVTADRVLDVLPSLARVGYEEFHLDAGWETSFADDGWHFEPERFPNGFAPIRQWLREHGLSFYIWWGLNDVTARKPAEVIRLIGETDVANIFFDRGVGEETVPALREIRKLYPGLSVMNHFAPSRSKNYPQVNLHLASELTQAYFAEEQYFQWSDVPPKQPKLDYNKRKVAAGDLVTRSLAYQANWVFPFRHVYPPGWPWAGYDDLPVDALMTRLNVMLSARFGYEWGEDPRDLPPALLDAFLDSIAFYKTMRPYRADYQHVLPIPDGIHPDGIAHLKDGKGYIFLFNPGNKPAEVKWKDLFYEPDLELDPAAKLTLSDWTSYTSARLLGTVDLTNPKGGFKMDPFSSRIIGVNIDLAATLAEVTRQRSLISRPE